MNRNDMGKEIKAEGKPPRNKREAADPVDPSNLTEDQEENGPAEKVRKGRPEPTGFEPSARGSIVGSGDETDSRPRSGTVMGNESAMDRTPTASGSIIGSGKGMGTKMTGPKSFTK